MRRALLIGINDYPQGHQLRGCVDDVNSLLSVLERHGNNDKNFDVICLKDVQTSDVAREKIHQLFHDDAEIALFYFSGHGYIDTNGGQLVFPNDILQCQQDSSCNMYGIPMSEIMQIANRSRAKNKVIILDCCHSGDMGKFQQDDTSHLAHGMSILTACREDETALELGGHGIFTELLVSALKGEAADFCGNITIGGVYAYIDRALGAWDQRPIFKTNVSEFVPLKKIAPRVSENDIRTVMGLFETSDTLFELDPSYENTNHPDIEHKIIKPYACPYNVAKFKLLQKLHSIGFVEPVNEEHMYFAAMKSKQCRLTEVGKYYWRLVKSGRI